MRINREKRLRLWQTRGQQLLPRAPSVWFRVSVRIRRPWFAAFPWATSRRVRFRIRQCRFRKQILCISRPSAPPESRNPTIPPRCTKWFAIWRQNPARRQSSPCGKFQSRPTDSNRHWKKLLKTELVEKLNWLEFCFKIWQNHSQRFEMWLQAGWSQQIGTKSDFDVDGSVGRFRWVSSTIRPMTHSSGRC